LIAATIEHPDRFIAQAHELCLAEPLLIGPDAVYEMGQMLAVFAAKFLAEQREAVENCIIALPETPDEEYREARARVRDRLLAQIPSSLLVTDEGKAIRADLEVTLSLPENRPLFTMSGGARAFTEDMWLAGQGVDLTVPVNKELRQATDDLMQALGSTRRDQATREKVEGVYPKAVRLENFLAADLVDDTTLKTSRLTKLAQFANSAIIAIEGRTSEITLLARRVLLRCTENPFPGAVPDMDETYTTPVWGDTPRNEAAQGLPFLLSRGADTEILEAIRVLARDPVPSARYLVTSALWRISDVLPDEFWQLLQEIAGRDKNAVVLQGVGESLWRVTGRNEKKAAVVLAVLAPRVLDGPDHSELARMFMALTMWLCIVRKRPWAVSLSAQLLNKPVKYSKALSRATTAALPFVKPSKTGDKEENDSVESAIDWLLKDVEAAEAGLVAIGKATDPPGDTNRLGIDAVVFEASAEVRALSVGINLLPHAVRELTIHGLADRIGAAAVATEELAYFNKFGAEIWREPRGVAAGYKWPQYSIHRGRFQMILLDEVVARIGADRVLTRHHLESFEDDDDGVTARFTDKATGASMGEHRGDILIGADGIHSAVGHKYYPHEQQPQYSGRVLWRATTEPPAFLTGRSMILAGYPDRKFVAYPISDVSPESGRALGTG
jgi:hypothetical protein